MSIEAIAALAGVAGVVVAVGTVALDLVKERRAARGERREARERVDASNRYRIEAFTQMAQLAFAQLVDLESGRVKTLEAAPGEDRDELERLDDEKKRRIKAALDRRVKDFLDVAAEDALQIGTHLDQRAADLKRDSRNTWHLMTCMLDARIDAPLDDGLMDTVCIGVIAPIALGLPYNRDESLRILGAAMYGMREDAPTRRHTTTFATDLLPPGVVADVSQAWLADHDVAAAHQAPAR